MSGDKVEEYNRLKKRAAEIRSEIDRAKGSLDGLMKQLQEEFGCSSLDEAQTLLRDLKTKRDEAETRYTALVEKFKSDYGDLI